MGAVIVRVILGFVSRPSDNMTNGKETIIKIDRYEPEIEKGAIVYYAIAGKKKYKMPDAYKDMYNENYLAITERTLDMPELFDVEGRHYIPLFTGGKS